MNIKILPWNEKIFRHRNNRHWTQEDAAEKCGVTLKAYWAWEHGIKYPTSQNRKRICKAFDVSIDEIFSNENTSDSVKKNTYHLSPGN